MMKEKVCLVYFGERDDLRNSACAKMSVWAKQEHGSGQESNKVEKTKHPGSGEGEEEGGTSIPRSTTYTKDILSSTLLSDVAFLFVDTNTYTSPQ
jgi:hypothetical protein